MIFSTAVRISERSCCRLKRNKGLLAALFVMVLWGLLFPTVKLGYRVFGISGIGDTLAFAGFRFLVCGVLITVYAAVKMPGEFAALKKGWWQVLLSGLFAIVLHYACTYVGLQTTDGSKTAILKQLGAVFYICFAALFFPEDKLTLNKVGGLLLGIAGIFAINTDVSGFRFQMGDFLILGASFCTVFSNVISKKAFKTVTPIVLTGVSQVFGGVVLLAVGALAGGNVGKLIPTTAAQAGVFSLICAASVFSYCIWFLTVQKENLSKLFIIKFSEPLFAAVFGFFLLKENIFKLNYLVAFLLICGGILVANRKKKSCNIPS